MSPYRSTPPPPLGHGETYFRTAFEAAAIGIGLVALDGRWLRVNRSLCELVGRTEAELIGLTFQDITHPDDRATDLAQVGRLIGGEIRSYSMEKRYIHKDGRAVWSLLSSTMVRAADGAPLHIIAQIQDITERRQAAARLEENEQRYRSLFVHHPDAVFSMDLESRFVSANPACHTVSGHALEELLGMPFAPLVAPEHLELTLSRFRAAAGGTAQTFEVVIRHKTGRPVDLGVTMIPIIVRGTVVGVFGIAKDLTEQHSLEAQLRQAQKMEAVGRLAGGIAHDFNNLLTGILSHSELVLRELPDGPVRQDADVIRETAERAAVLTRQLLAFSRKQVVQPRLLDLNAVVAGTERMLRRTLGAGVTLEADLGAAGGVLADTGQLEQVLVNLAMNARDAMPHGGRLTLRTRDLVVDDTFARRYRGLRPGAYVALSAEDTGIGMPPEIRARIFEPFFTTKPVGQGTGLGLSTVYGIVKQWGGYSAVQSAPGQGTTLTIYLPRQEGTPEPRQPTAPDRLPTGVETILVVEDEALVRSSIHRILTRHGYTVVEASHGAEALRITDHPASRVDLVMTDLVMPEMGGRELIAELRARASALRIVAMSGYDEQAAIRGEALPPGTSFLEKPFTIEGLLRTVREALDASAERG